MHTQDLPSSATLAVSLKLLQWLRVSMEASSSLKGCTCPCCPPGGKKQKQKHISTGNITQSNQVKCISAVQQVSVHSLCNPGSTQVLWQIQQLSNQSYVLCTPYLLYFYYLIWKCTMLSGSRATHACVDCVNTTLCSGWRDTGQYTHRQEVAWHDRSSDNLPRRLLALKLLFGV